MPKDHPYTHRVDIGVDVIADNYYDAVVLAWQVIRDWQAEASMCITARPYDEETGTALIFGPRAEFKVVDIDP